MFKALLRSANSPDSLFQAFVITKMVSIELVITEVLGKRTYRLASIPESKKESNDEEKWSKRQLPGYRGDI